MSVAVPPPVDSDTKTDPGQRSASPGSRPGRPLPWRVRDALAGYAMMLPTLVPYVAFGLLPVLWLIWISFQDYNGFSDPTFVGLENYARMLRDGRWHAAIVRTFVFAGGQLIVVVPLAMVLAYVFYREIFATGVFKTIFFLPYALSSAIIGIVFRFLLQRTGGPLNGVLVDWGVIDIPINFLGDAETALASLIGAGVWRNVGILTLLFLAGMTTIPKEITESAAVDGCGPFRTFWHIILPLLRPVSRVVILIMIINTLRSFDLIKTMTDGGPAGQTDVMFTYLYSYFFEPTSIPQIGYAAALGVTASVIIAIASIAYAVIRREES